MYYTTSDGVMKSKLEDGERESGRVGSGLLLTGEDNRSGDLQEAREQALCLWG